MRIFVAGASGVIGVRLVPRLVAAGHQVAGMTRSPNKLAGLEALGAQPVLCDVYDADGLRNAVAEFAPDAVMHQMTDLPDDVGEIGDYGPRNDRIRIEGTRNLLDAGQAVAAERFYAQSIAWKLPPPRGQATVEFEGMVLEAGGVIIRYGQLYGPGTYYEDEQPPPRVQIDDAARRTMPILDAAPGIVEVVE